MIKKRKVVLASILLACTLAVSCTPPNWISVAESIAKVTVPIAGSIVSLVDPSLSGDVAKIEQGFTALTGALDTFKATPTVTNQEKVVAVFNAVNVNVSALSSAAQVKNPNSDQTVKSVVALLTQAVTAIAKQIPASQVGAAQRAGLPATLNIGAASPSMTANDLKRAFNDTVAGDSRFQKIQ